MRRKTLQQASSAHASKKHKKLFVGGFDTSTPKKEIFNYFSQFGQIQKIITQYGQDGRPTGHCFIKFAESGAVSRVLSQTEHFFGGRVLECRPLLKGQALQRMKDEFDDQRVFVSNIDLRTTERDLHEFLSPHARIKNCFVSPAVRSKRTKIAFVTLFDADGARKLMRLNNRLKLFSNSLCIKPYVRKEKLKNGGGHAWSSEQRGRQRRGPGRKRRRRRHQRSRRYPEQPQKKETPDFTEDFLLYKYKDVLPEVQFTQEQLFMIQEFDRRKDRMVDSRGFNMSHSFEAKFGFQESELDIDEEIRPTQSRYHCTRSSPIGYFYHFFFIRENIRYNTGTNPEEESQSELHERGSKRFSTPQRGAPSQDMHY